MRPPSSYPSRGRPRRGCDLPRPRPTCRIPDPSSRSNRMGGRPLAPNRFYRLSAPLRRCLDRTFRFLWCQCVSPRGVNRGLGQSIPARRIEPTRQNRVHRRQGRPLWNLPPRIRPERLAPDGVLERHHPLRVGRGTHDQPGRIDGFPSHRPRGCRATCTHF